MDATPEDQPGGVGRDAEPAAEVLAGSSAGRSAIREWLLGAPGAALAATDAYRRYKRLLPQVLAGTLPAQSADAEWFQTYLDECAACLTEYDELQEALDTDRAARLAFVVNSDTLPVWPVYDLAFLAAGRAAATAARSPPALARAAAIWDGPIRPVIRVYTEAGQPGAQVTLVAEPTPPPARLAAAAAALASPPAEEKPLLTRTIHPDPTQGIHQPYLLAVSAARTDATTCALHIRVLVPGQPGAAAGLVVRVTRPDGAELQALTDTQGAAYLALPIEDLAHLVIHISLPGGAAPGTP